MGFGGRYDKVDVCALRLGDLRWLVRDSDLPFWGGLLRPLDKRLTTRSPIAAVDENEGFQH